MSSLTEYTPLPTNGNGGIYDSGFVTAQQNAAAQNALIQSTTGGKKKHYNHVGGGISVAAIPVPYNDGGSTQGLVTELTKLNANQQTQAAYDSKVTRGGKSKKYKHKKSRKTRKHRKTRKTRKHQNARRIRRRHM